MTHAFILMAYGLWLMASDHDAKVFHVWARLEARLLNWEGLAFPGRAAKTKR